MSWKCDVLQSGFGKVKFENICACGEPLKHLQTMHMVDLFVMVLLLQLPHSHLPDQYENTETGVKAFYPIKGPEFELGGWGPHLGSRWWVTWPPQTARNKLLKSRKQ